MRTGATRSRRFIIRLAGQAAPPPEYLRWKTDYSGGVFPMVREQGRAPCRLLSAAVPLGDRGDSHGATPGARPARHPARSVPSPIRASDSNGEKTNDLQD